MRIAAIAACLALVTSASLYADFSYEQTTKITGGVLSGALKVVGVFSKQAAQPVKTAVLIKGNRMANASADSVQVIDLDKETITDINLRNKTYSVITFAQMAQATEQLAKKTAEQTGGKVDASFKASVQETGQTKQIAGLNTRQVILTLTMEGTDKESGNKGAMDVRADMWLARDVPGYEEVRNFYQHMSQKLAWMPGSSALAQGRSDMAKAFADLARESSKLEGVPVLQVVAMGGSAEVQPGQSSPPAQAQPQPERETPSIGGALGRLGGLGGLGRRKQEPPKQEQPPQQQAPASASASLMEMTTETTGFSTGAIDAARFEVPAGFRQVESELLKSLR